MFGVIVHLLIAFGGNFASGFSPRSCQPVDENGSFQDLSLEVTAKVEG